MKKHMAVHGYGKKDKKKKKMVVHGDGKKNKKKKMVLHGGNTPCLADEIITNILKRLSVKSLMRFQCVCKKWKNLMKSPYFITDHHHHHHHDASNQNPSSLLFEQRGDRDDDPLNLFVVDCDNQGLSLDLDEPPFVSFRSRHEITGTCNGLMCVLSGTLLFLWNPATREVRRVPGVIHGDKYGYSHLGFGFSPILNDYKIVRIFMSRKVKRVEVYSLNTDCWREVEFGNILNGVLAFHASASVNGSIFWHVLTMHYRKEVVDSRNEIISFDIDKEVFTLMPVHLEMNTYRISTIFVHDKKLVLARLSNITGGIDFWEMMEEEGVDDASGSKKWSWMNVDIKRPYLSHLYTKITNYLSHRVSYVLSYVESLVPIVG